ncbi:unnamed protein product [Rhizophagus irregularis]|uniref:Uncharacterized protein n=1 Tax=Rhizophagus irregularis TaxID=588596 RepID=A0A2I1H9X3_9GLOM|nr:hypothetical protein RhiirA4_475287 [Rhizophagus irregularis]CAB4424396.1 unnamed protein product [Rhizophagus irregularis]CAB4424674.1 unnamed protein product [Rhizophagus irregularis]
MDFKKTLKLYWSISATGLSQTLEEIDFKVHNRLLNFEAPFSEELEQLGADKFDELIFSFYTFKNLWTTLFYEAANTFMSKIQKELHA